MKKGFTLAEVLITLAIIGIVAAITIPSVIVNTQQNEFKTGLKKAVSVLNQAIMMAQAEDGVSPYDQDISGSLAPTKMMMFFSNSNSAGREDDLYYPNIIAKHMSIIKKDTYREKKTNAVNGVFYTTDGMRFEFPLGGSSFRGFPLHGETDGSKVYTHGSAQAYAVGYGRNTGEGTGCGSYGLQSNPNGTTSSPCVVIVDVNGDRKPNPVNLMLRTYGDEDDLSTEMVHNQYTWAKPEDKKVTDIFPILITESKAIPYGVAAQKAMYQARGKK